MENDRDFGDFETGSSPFMGGMEGHMEQRPVAKDERWKNCCLVVLIVTVIVVIICVVIFGLFADKGVGRDNDEKSLGQENSNTNSSSLFELNNGCFRLMYVKEEDSAFRIASITNIRPDVTSVDIRQFATNIFHHLLSSKLEKGTELALDDEVVLYFSMDAWFKTMEDIIAYVKTKMRPVDDCDGIPDDFGQAPCNVKLPDVSNARTASAHPREQLRHIREIGIKNLGDCDVGVRIDKFGKDFWGISQGAFLYQLSTIFNSLKDQNGKHYLEPCFENGWGMLRTNDPELAAYVIDADVVQDRAMVDHDFKMAFDEMDAMIDKIHMALDMTGDKTTSNALYVVSQEFEEKYAKLKADIDLIIVDIPVAIYIKIALNDIDKAKGIIDTEKDISAALKRFHERTESGKLVLRVMSSNVRSLYRQLVEKARAELGDTEVEKILGEAWR